MTIQITKSQVRRALWKRRDTKFILKTAQKDLREKILACDSKTFVANAHRQFGKSTAMFQFADEYAWKNPNSFIKIGAPTNGQVKDIIKVAQRTVFMTCPKDLRPIFNKSDSEFLYPNGSMIKLVGVDINPDRLRGTPNDLVILDEVGFMRNLDGLIKDEILPTFNQRPNGRLILISTPPKVLAHDYSQKFIPKAKLMNAYWELPITTNPDFNPEQIRKFASEYDIVDASGKVLKKGEDTSNFKREYLCEVVPDETRLVFPEWQLFKGKDERGLETHQLMGTFDQPVDYHPLVFADWGFKDHTGVIFGWVDFLSGSLVCKDEIWVHNERAGTTAAAIKERASTLFSGTSIDDVKWYVDADMSLLHELRHQTGLDWRSANGWIKQNKEGNINRTRERISKSLIKVDKQCANLALQLDKGVWNKTRNDWERSELMGHCDLLAALIYMVKVAPWNDNPTPAKVITDPNVFISPKHNYNEKPNDLARAFGGFKR